MAISPKSPGEIDTNLSIGGRKRSYSSNSEEKVEEVASSSMPNAKRKKKQLEEGGVTFVSLPLLHPIYSGRIRVNPSSNFTITRVRDSVFVEDETVTDLLSDHVKASKLEDMILDHAFRRIQIMYYQCVAYYQEGCTVSLAPTDLQHGSSSFSEYHAAHSSILPHISDHFLEQFQERLNNEGVTKKNGQRLQALGVTESDIIEIKKDSNFLQKTVLWKENRELINESSFFYHTMNSTLEMPKEVDYYDQLLEEHLRPKAIELLNKVSKEGLHPYRALREFIVDLQECIKLTQYEIQKKIEWLENLDRVENEIITLENEVRAGSIPDDKELFERYIALFVLRHELTWNLLHKREFSPVIKSKHRLREHDTLFNKLNVFFMNEKNTILKPKQHPRQLFLCVQSILKKYKSINEPHIHPRDLFEGLTRYSTKEKLQEAINSYWEQCDLVELTLRTTAKRSKEYGSRLRASIMDLEEVSFIISQDQLELLRTSLEISKSQEEGTQLPQYKELSGKCIAGKRVPFSKNELFEQKIQIITRGYQVNYVHVV
jgi:hypothetical protein